MMGLAITRALFTTPPIVADIDAEKRKTALAAGAAQAYDPSDQQARKAVMSATGGGLLAICDFVGSDKSLQFATGLLARGGKVVVTGLLGGNFSIAAAMFGIKAMTIEGTLTGTLAEARELLDLARAMNIAPIPTRDRPLGEAQAALDDLRAGRIVGRTVLTA
jgi:alcohol dehydrogenase, propanol-preferring